jgi:hypothetical protein
MVNGDASALECKGVMGTSSVPKRVVNDMKVVKEDYELTVHRVL